MYGILENFNNTSLQEIERRLTPTKKISEKVDKVIKSEIKMADKEFAP